MTLENLPLIGGEAAAESEKFLFFASQEYVVDFIANAIGFVGLFVMVLGVIKSLYELFLRFYDRRIVMSRIRMDLGSYLVLALEFLVAKDILESIFNPSLQTLTELFIIVLIRTILTYFLNKELAQVKAEVKEELEEIEAAEKLPRRKR